VSRVNDQLEAFSDQNLLLQMLLGVLSETDRVERLLPQPVARAGPPVSVTVDAFLAALLGIVSLRQHLRDVMSDKSAQRAERDGEAGLPLVERPSRIARRRPPTIRELMR